MSNTSAAAPPASCTLEIAPHLQLTLACEEATGRVYVMLVSNDNYVSTSEATWLDLADQLPRHREDFAMFCLSSGNLTVEINPTFSSDRNADWPSWRGITLSQAASDGCGVFVRERSSCCELQQIHLYRDDYIRIASIMPFAWELLELAKRCDSMESCKFPICYSGLKLYSEYNTFSFAKADLIYQVYCPPHYYPKQSYQNRPMLQVSTADGTRWLSLTPKYCEDILRFGYTVSSRVNFIAFPAKLAYAYHFALMDEHGNELKTSLCAVSAKNSGRDRLRAYENIMCFDPDEWDMFIRIVNFFLRYYDKACRY